MNYPNFEKLIEVVRKLRDPKDGCPWDLKQTHKSLLKFLIEESYEFIEAVENEDFKEMEEEIGDVLLQVLLHGTLAEEQNKFDIESISKVLCDKMIRRHPHVFENPNNGIDVSDVITNWDKIKLEEKGHKEYQIDESTLHLPALASSNKIGKKSHKIGFDWDSADQVMYKVEEEWQELKEELAPKTRNKQRMEEELGDFLFSTAQLARHLDIDPEEALRNANKKFIKRYKAMEDLIKSESKSVLDMNQKEMDVYWDLAKKQEKMDAAKK